MSAYTAAAQLVRRVGDFAQRQPRWGECIVYETKPDERWDLTLVSRRVYGTSDEYLVIMSAAGLDSVEQELTERTIVLPTARQLANIKKLCGLVNSRWARPAEVSADPIRGR